MLLYEWFLKKSYLAMKKDLRMFFAIQKGTFGTGLEWVKGEYYTYLFLRKKLSQLRVGQMWLESFQLFQRLVLPKFLQPCSFSFLSVRSTYFR